MNIDNIFFQILQVAEQRPDKVAIKTDQGRKVTYAEIVNESTKFANALNEIGVKKGERILVQAEKTLQSLFLYLGCLQVGVVYVPVNTAYKNDEMEFFVRDAEPSLIVGVPENQGALKSVATQTTGARVLTINDQETNSLTELAAKQKIELNQSVRVSSEDLAVLVYTSGTTGRPKGAMLSHKNVTKNARLLIKHWNITEEDNVLHALPIFHIHGLFVALNTALYSGAGIIWQQSFVAERVLDSLFESTVFMGVPTYYSRLLAIPRFGKSYCAGVRLFVSGSAPLLAQTHKDFENRTGHKILERYGMSETGIITSNPLVGERREGTVGFPLEEGSVRVVMETDSKSAVSQKGIVQVKSESVFKGYWRRPEKTNSEFTESGWFLTGDIGFFDKDGYLTLVGRAKDLIITGGYNVYPKEIELVINEIEEVKESAVVGIPDQDFGERVVAAIVVMEGRTLDAEKLIQVVKKRVANYKVPKQIEFFEELPRNAMGKVQKNIVRQILEAG